jgi:putative acetyltransferase
LVEPRFVIRSPESAKEWKEVKRLLLDYKAEFNDDTCFTSFEAEIADIENLYARDDHFKLIAVSVPDGTIVGCVAFRALAPDIAEMKRMYVVPGYRGQQLGRKLAEAIISKAVERGYQKMVLDTMMEMKAAQQLYHDLGFVIIPPYDDQDTSKVICFEKELKTS